MEQIKKSIKSKLYDVIIVGGSFAGLSAALSLGRAMRKVLVIDDNKPCNRTSNKSHNLLTRDGFNPLYLLQEARKEVSQYANIFFIDDFANKAKKRDNFFEITTKSQKVFNSRKVILATGVMDILPKIAGYKECWGISIVHCPYCHGYEFKNLKTAVCSDGIHGYDFASLIFNWTKDVTLIINDFSELNKQQIKKLNGHGIKIIESSIKSIEHSQGVMKSITFNNGINENFDVLYDSPLIIPNNPLALYLGCEVNDYGYIQVSDRQMTSVEGVYSCGDNISLLRTLANAVASGSLAGAAANRAIIEEEF